MIATSVRAARSVRAAWSPPLRGCAQVWRSGSATASSATDSDGATACTSPAPAANAARDALVSAVAGRRVVLTPHAGEFRTLFPELSSDAAVDPWGAAQIAADTIGAVIVLKGVPTVVASPGGSCLTVAAGNPGLATGGSGDTLSGLVGALLAQGLAPDLAGALGALALGRAADLAARRSSARTLRPMEVLAALPDLWREWDLLRRVPPIPRPPVLLELEAPLRV